VGTGKYPNPCHYPSWVTHQEEYLDTMLEVFLNPKNAELASIKCKDSLLRTENMDGT
jgi:hypothetical protein